MLNIKVYTVKVSGRGLWKFLCDDLSRQYICVKLFWISLCLPSSTNL